MENGYIGESLFGYQTPSQNLMLAFKTLPHGDPNIDSSIKTSCTTRGEQKATTNSATLDHILRTSCGDHQRNSGHFLAAKQGQISPSQNTNAVSTNEFRPRAATDTLPYHYRRSQRRRSSQRAETAVDQHRPRSISERIIQHHDSHPAIVHTKQQNQDQRSNASDTHDHPGASSSDIFEIHVDTNASGNTNHLNLLTCASGDTVRSERKHPHNVHRGRLSCRGNQKVNTEGGWLARARARSDTHLHKKHDYFRGDDWQVIKDSTALLPSSSSTSSSGTEGDSSSCDFIEATVCGSRDYLEPQAHRSMSTTYPSTETNGYTIGSTNMNSLTHSTAAISHSNNDKCSNNSNNNNNNNNNNKNKSEIYVEQRQSCKRKLPSVPAKMDYLTVPTKWRSFSPVGDGATAHPPNRRHSSYDSRQHQQKQLAQQQQQQDQPLLQRNQEEILRERKRRRFLLGGKAKIWLSTRVVFLLLVLLGMGVILTSMWLMLECKRRFLAVRPLLPNNSSFCNTMGMPALFAACTVLFTICGLACTGRKFTGYALIVISSVEILQSVTTLTFYNCRVLSAGRVLASVNDSLLECHAAVQPLESSHAQPQMAQLKLVGDGGGEGSSRMVAEKAPPSSGVSVFPFSVSATKTESSPTRPPLAQSKQKPERHPERKITDSIKVGLDTDTDSVREPIRKIADDDGDTFLKRIETGRYIRSARRNAHQRLVDRPDLFDREQENGADDTGPGPRLGVSMVSSEGEAGVKSFSQHVDCTSDSKFFQLLTQSATKETVDKCKHVCRTYQAVCEVSREDYLEEDILDKYRQTSGDKSVNIDRKIYRQAGWQASGSESLRGGNRFLSTESAQKYGLSRQDEFYRFIGRAGRDQFGGSSGDFQWAVEQCGRRVERRVHNLCYYDNQIILPMSMCAPVAYIFFSCCFIYLARCEKARKEREGCSKIITSASTSSSTNTTTLMMSSTGAGQSTPGSTFSCTSSTSGGEIKVGSLVSRLRRCFSRSPCGRKVSLARHSQSSHELLRLQTVMYSISTIVGLTMIESDVAAEVV